MVRSPSVETRIALEMICPYEPGKPIEEVKRELGLTRVLKLASNENPLGPSPKVIEHLNKSDLELHMYPDYEGWYLRRDLAAHLGVKADQLVTGAGSVEIMRLLADAYLDRGDEGLVADICFPVYANCIHLAGATPVVVPLDDDFNYDLQRMLEAVTPRTKVVFLATPNNPTGRRIPAADVTAFIEQLPKRVLCVLDLAYWEYLDRELAEDEKHDPMRLLAAHANVVLLRTFSKVYGLAGLRVGYAVAAAEVIKSIGRVRIPFSTSTAAQVAARVALQDPEHVTRSAALNAKSRTALVKGLADLGVKTWPSQANFILGDCGMESDVLFERLLRRGIIVRPQRQARLRTCLRITTGTLEQTEALLEAMSAELRQPAPA
jgi:histidinol-phosphate aminotransferase